MSKDKALHQLHASQRNLQKHSLPALGVFGSLHSFSFSNSSKCCVTSRYCIKRSISGFGYIQTEFIYVSIILFYFITKLLNFGRCPHKTHFYTFHGHEKAGCFLAHTCTSIVNIFPSSRHNLTFKWDEESDNFR
jgi:hypothetical protein